VKNRRRQVYSEANSALKGGEGFRMKRLSFLELWKDELKKVELKLQE
jgi:hypothetical protein